MSRIIKNFDSFSHEEVNENFDWNQLGGIFSGLVKFAGDDIATTIKQKITAKLMEQFGIEENSVLSALVQEAIGEIPLSDYPKLLTGENANVEYLAPLMAEAVQRLIQRKGLDGIAKQIGFNVDPPNNRIYSVVRNGLQGEIGKEKLTNLIINILGGDSAKGSVGADALNALDPRDKKQLSDAMKNKAAQFYGKTSTVSQSKTGNSPTDYISTFFNSLSGKNES
jgi:hypothetical protein